MKIRMTTNSLFISDTFKKLQKYVPQMVRATVKKSAMRTTRGAKINCKTVDTGLLRASITSEQWQNWLSAEVGTHVKYAPYIEYGTGIYAVGGGGRQSPWSWYSASGKWKGWHTTRGMHPHPFLHPAWKKEEPEYKKSMKLSLVEATKRSSGGL